MPVDYKLVLNDAITSLRPSPTLGVMKKAKERKEAGKEVFDFSVGKPAEPTPDYVRDALIARMQNPADWATMSAYTLVSGLPELRKNIAQKFADENGITYNADSEITTTNGGKQAIYNALAVTMKEGDEVLMAEPSWVSYPDMAKWDLGTPVGVRTNGDFKFTAEALKSTIAEHPKAKWLIINSPSNPTGATYTLDELKAIAAVVLDENKSREAAGKPPLMVMSDDIYEHMVYDDKYVNKPGDPAAISNNIIMANPDVKPYTVIVNGMAKAFGMTGWRVGYAAGPDKIIKAMTDYQSLVSSNISAISQIAASEALSPKNKQARDAFFTTQRASYIKRRALVSELINVPGSSMSFKPTPGAFYAMIECTELAKAAGGCHALAEKLIMDNGVALVAGDDFFIDPKGQKTYLRMSYATDEKTIRAGIAAMQAAEKAIMPGGPANGKAA